MPGADITALLKESFTLLRREAPRAEALIENSLGGATIELEVSGKCTSIRVLDGALVATATRKTQSTQPQAKIRIQDTDLLQLIDGDLHPLDLLHSDRLWVQASASLLHDLLYVLRIYVLSAVSVPGFDVLLSRLREATNPPPRR